MTQERMDLWDAMELYGVTLSQVAEACGHREQTVRRWLNGEGRGFWLSDAENIQKLLFPDVPVGLVICWMIEATHSKAL